VVSELCGQWLRVEGWRARAMTAGVVWCTRRRGTVATSTQVHGRKDQGW
jgi:hypothetical protein